MVEMAFELLNEVCTIAIPIAVVFELGNKVIGMFMRVAFGGKLWF